MESKTYYSYIWKVWNGMYDVQLNYYHINIFHFIISKMKLFIFNSEHWNVQSFYFVPVIQNSFFTCFTKPLSLSLRAICCFGISIIVWIKAMVGCLLSHIRVVIVFIGFNTKINSPAASSLLSDRVTISVKLFFKYPSIVVLQIQQTIALCTD